MNFQWDERKNQGNIRKHGFDFQDAERVFTGPVLIVADERRDYGEVRFTALGFLEDVLVFIAYSMRSEEDIRVISMRKATSAERRFYEKETSL